MGQEISATIQVRERVNKTLLSAESFILEEIRALPTGWYIAYDPETKRDYYFNTYTNHSQWHFPSEAQAGGQTQSNNQKQAETSKLEQALKNVRVTLSSESLRSSSNSFRGG